MARAPWIIAAATAFLAACVTPDAVRAEADAKPSPISRSEVAEASRPPQNECNAAAYQNLVGKKKSDIPPKPPNAVWRIACTSCPVTMDYAPVRLNIFFDQQTEVIKEVRCG